MSEETAITILPARVETDLAILNPVMSLDMAKQRLRQLQELVKDYLVDGEDYGTIPDTQKPTLFKSGADKLCDVYGLADDYDLIRELTHEEPNAAPPLYDYAFRCRLTRKGTDILMSTGMGSCSSYESKYRYRDSRRICPKCQKPTIIKGKEEFGGGWLCFAKRGGCGAKFGDNDPAIVNQAIGRADNENLADIKNTIIKMALKRAKVSAVISATRSSGLFTQDMEDISPDLSGGDHEPQQPPARHAEAPATRSAAPSNDGAIISEAQGKRLFAIAKGKGFDRDDIVAYLQAEYGLEAIGHIPRSKYEAIVAHFERGGTETAAPAAAAKPATQAARPKPGAPF